MCVGSYLVGCLQKRLIDLVKTKKKGLDVRQAGTMVHDRREWQGFVRGGGGGECLGHVC